MKKISSKYLDFLTDDFGVWQHSDKNKINYKFGYALDDAARGLVLAHELKNIALGNIYQSFLELAFSGNPVINFYDKRRMARGLPSSEDAIGEAYWGASYTKNQKLISKIESHLSGFQYLRGKAYAILGAVNIGNEKIAKKFANDTVNQFNINKSIDRQWPENDLTYANAIIPYAILSCAEKFDAKILVSALSMLDFVNRQTKISGNPMAIGNDGWFKKGGEKALFDQQPIDPAYQVLANVKAWEITKDKKYLDEAKIYFSWFWGNNIVGKPLINADGSCADGICFSGISENRGAESIICFLLAQEEIWKYL